MKRISLILALVLCLTGISYSQAPIRHISKKYQFIADADSTVVISDSINWENSNVNGFFSIDALAYKSGGDSWTSRDSLIMYSYSTNKKNLVSFGTSINREFPQPDSTLIFRSLLSSNGVELGSVDWQPSTSGGIFFNMTIKMAVGDTTEIFLTVNVN